MSNGPSSMQRVGQSQGPGRCRYRKRRPGEFGRLAASGAGEMADPIPASSAGEARERPVGTVSAHVGQDIFTLGIGFMASGANVQIPSRGPRVSRREMEKRKEELKVYR